MSAAAGCDTAETFERQMSLLSTHEMLRSRLAALPHVGALNIFNAQGWLINSSRDVAGAGRQRPRPPLLPRIHLRQADAGRSSSNPSSARSRETGPPSSPARSSTATASIIGFASRGVEPTHFEEFVALARAGHRHHHLDDPSRRHGDRALSAGCEAGRQEHLGQSGVPARDGRRRQLLRTLRQQGHGRRPDRRGPHARSFPDRDHRRHHDRDRAGRLARADPAAVLAPPCSR